MALSKKYSSNIVVGQFGRTQRLTNLYNFVSFKKNEKSEELSLNVLSSNGLSSIGLNSSGLS